MKLTAKLIVITLLILAVNKSNFAQVSDYSLKYGIQGHLLAQDTEFPNHPYNTSPFLRGFFRFPLISVFDVEIGAGYGALNAVDNNEHKWRTNLVPADLRIVLNLFTGETWEFVVYGGGGILRWNVQEKPITKSPSDTKSSGWHGFIPLGGGLEFAVSDNVLFNLSGGYNFTFTDDLNYYNNWTSNSTTNDGYFNGGLGLTFVSGSGASDADNDGLTKKQEKELGTNPDVADTDGDGLTDGEEFLTFNTDPLKADSDGDGLNDGAEFKTYKTNPNSADSDNDGLTDTDEVNKYKSNPLSDDSDKDGLKDATEIELKTDMNNSDTDGDGLKDGDEVNKYKTDAKSKDTDKDGLSDYDEVMKYKTNPTDKDTDKGTVDDKTEVDRGTNPLNPKDDVILDVSKPIVLEGVTFETGKAEITPESEKVLMKAYNTLLAYPDMKVEIRGYTDNVGSARANKRLSQRRADAVRNWLIAKGISPDRITAVGMGEANPIADNSTPEGRKLNRRIEFVRINK